MTRAGTMVTKEPSRTPTRSRTRSRINNPEGRGVSDSPTQTPARNQPPHPPSRGAVVAPVAEPPVTPTSVSVSKTVDPGKRSVSGKHANPTSESVSGVKDRNRKTSNNGRVIGGASQSLQWRIENYAHVASVGPSRIEITKLHYTAIVAWRIAVRHGRWVCTTQIAATDVATAKSVALSWAERLKRGAA